MNRSRYVSGQNGNGRYVTQNQFDVFVQHIDQRFNTQNETLQKIERNQTESNKPQYQVIIAILSIGVSMVGGAGILGYTYVESSSKLHIARDDSLEQKIEFLQNGSNRFSREDFRFERGVIDERFDEQRDQLYKLLEYDREITEKVATLMERARIMDSELAYRKSWMDRTNERSIKIESQLEERSRNQDRLFDNQKILLQGQYEAKEREMGK